MAAWAFTRFSFPGRRFLFWLFLASMMIPSIVTIIPVFSMVTSWGWSNTFYGLIAPTLSSAYGVFLLRQFFQTLPKDIEDAARIDGASELTVFTRVVLPLSKPGLITLAVLTFVANWTEFMWPYIITSTEEMRTLEVGLQLFFNPALIDWPVFMAASLLTLLPVVLLFIFTHRFFIRGIALSGMKG
jgi:multiple sugar transport system permease protein